MTEDTIILKAQNIFKSYKMGTNKVPVLKDLSLSVTQGDFIAILGSSGSGKSTLLHILGALDSPDKGDVIFEGKRLNQFSARQLNRFRNKRVGFVFQFYHLLDELNVVENAMLPFMAGTGVVGYFSNKQKVRQNALKLLAQFELSHRIRHKPYQLSGGERQRVAIIRALINDPDILLADEPTGNLDSKTGYGILQVFEQLNKAGQTIVMVTHDQKIAQFAKRVIVLKDGQIKAE